MRGMSQYHKLYGSRAWYRLRHYQLAKAPLCAYCEAQGLTVAASIVDHIRPHKGDISLFSDPDNLQSLCKRCHDSHKQRQEKSGKVLGCDTQGQPLSPHKYW